MESCAFDKLFTKSIPHILEKIFFSLDYASFKNCKEVSRAWNELLSTKRYQEILRLKKEEEKLWNASKGGRSDEVRRLLSSGMLDMDCKFEVFLDTPLHEASMSGHKEVVQLLLNKGADLNKKNEYGSTPLHAASLNGHKRVVQLLLDNEANPKKTNGTGSTPLHEASMCRRKEVVLLLLEGGAERDVTGKYGWTPLDYASRNGHKDVEKVLVEWRGSL